VQAVSKPIHRRGAAGSAGSIRPRGVPAAAFRRPSADLARRRQPSGRRPRQI